MNKMRTVGISWNFEYKVGEATFASNCFTLNFKNILKNNRIIRIK